MANPFDDLPVENEPQADNPFADLPAEGGPLPELDAQDSGIQGFQNPTPPRTLSESVFRALGLTARAGAQGLAGVAGIVTDPIGFTVNKASEALGGPQLSSQNLRGDTSDLLTEAGVPEPQGAERISSAIAEGVAGAGGFVGTGQAIARNAPRLAGEVGRVLAADPGTQAASFGAASGAVEALPEDTSPLVKGAVGLGAAAVPAVGGAALLRTPRTGIPGAANTADDAAALRDVPTPRSTAIPETSGQPSASVGRPTLDVPVDITPPVSSEQIVSQLRRGKTQAVADAVVPDVKIVESAQRLGVDLNPEHYSTNTAFQDVARALKSQPGSTLQKQEVAALDAVARQADDLVVTNNGFLDKSQFNIEIGTQINSTIDDLAAAANTAYAEVNSQIPRQAKVDTALIREFIERKLADFGGDKSQLSKVEKQLLALTRNTKGGEPINPTYATLDNIRRNVGEGFNKRSGPFKNGTDANLREVYGILSDVQNGVARAYGVGDLYAGARGLVVTRKAIEDQAVQLFGRNASGSLVPKIRGSATGLVSGDVSKFNQLINALPENRRAEAAATVLAEIFSGGSRRGGELGTGFVASFAALNRNKAAKDLIFSHLPAEARKRFDDIGRVLTGIVESNRKPLSNPSGSAGPIVAALKDLSVVEKVMGAGARMAAAEGVSSSVGIPGAGTAGVLFGLLNKQRTPVIVAADNMIASPAFTRAINKAIEGDAATANQIIENSPAFKVWATKIGKEEAQQIARIGFIEWVTDNGR